MKDEKMLDDNRIRKAISDFKQAIEDMKDCDKGSSIIAEYRAKAFSLLRNELMTPDIRKNMADFTLLTLVQCCEHAMYSYIVPKNGNYHMWKGYRDTMQRERDGRIDKYEEAQLKKKTPRKQSLKQLRLIMPPNEEGTVTVVTMTVAENSVKVQESCWETEEDYEDSEEDPHTCLDTETMTYEDMSEGELDAFLAGMEVLSSFPLLKTELASVKGLFS